MKYVCAALVALACCGCSSPVADISDPALAMAWIHERVRYVSDADVWGRDYWQLPETTLRLGTGDCEDFCILFMKIMGESCSLVTVKGGDGTHAMVEYSDVQYDVSGCQAIPEGLPVESRYSYAQTMSWAFMDSIFN